MPSDMASSHSYTSLSDVELIQLWRDGDGEATDELVLRYNVPLQRFLGSQLVEPDACADLIQSVMEALLSALPRFKGSSSVRTYIFRIASNKLNQHLRELYAARRRGAREEFDSGKVSFQQIHDRSVSSIVGSKQRSAQLRRVLETLPVDDHRMLLLSYWDELSAREIGEVFDMNEDAVRAKLYRLRVKLGKLIQADEETVKKRLRDAGEDVLV